MAEEWTLGGEVQELIEWSPFQDGGGTGPEIKTETECTDPILDPK